jgi:hypothetical protein
MNDGERQAAMIPSTDHGMALISAHQGFVYFRFLLGLHKLFANRSFIDVFLDHPPILSETLGVFFAPS